MGWRISMCLLLLATMLTSSASATHTSLRLGGHNTILSAGDGTVDLVLPRDVTLPLKGNTRAGAGPAPWITFEGDGRVLGIVLIPKGSVSPISSGLVAVQFRSCPRGCRERPVNALMINGASFRGRETLPSGEYRLYVFTDGERVTIRLDLPQLTGATTLHVRGQGNSDIRTPAMHVDRRDDVTVYSAGSSYEMKDHAGVFMSVNVMRDDNYHGAWFDECLSDDHPAPNELEEIRCFPAGFTGLHPDFRRTILPRRGGFILTTFVSLNDSADNVINGDSSLQHYNFRVISPGPMGELWSQGMLLSL